MNASYAPGEMMTIAASRLLKNGDVCFVGIGRPNAAANLARLTHAPEIVLVYESGAIGAKPATLPISIGDDVIAERAQTIVSIPEIFTYWLQGGRIGIGFLGAAQIDRFANINTTVIGSYARPQSRLPGAGGAPEIATHAREVFVIMDQSLRSFVKKLDFLTTVGHLDGGDSRARTGARGAGPSVVITQLGVLRPDPASKELVLTQIHPTASVEDARAATGWELRVADDCRTTEPPTPDELAALRALNASRAATPRSSRL
ncbi:MAG: CoA-transferase subunit beta [Candidatus Eremiobacteraeota bacterium]|nr:CoA-transferase subunit beta [Candidatus Eremiobacteraeota bacterium]